MSERLAGALSGLPPVVAFLVALLGGIISSFSACGLSTVPLLVGSVGGYAKQNVVRTILYTGVFCGGVILVSTALGGLAAFGGRLLLARLPYWNIVLAVIMAAVGLYLWGALEGSSLACRLPSVRPGLFGAFLLGAGGGALATPCATPMLVAILAVASGTGSPLLGVMLLLAYGIGHVALPFAAGLSFGLIERVARTEAQLRIGLWGKRLFGFLALTAAFYLLLYA